MISRVVTLGGPPGSGKSTAARLAGARLGLTLKVAGAMFRDEARRRGLDVEAFGHYARDHPEVDRDLDRAMQAEARPGVLLEGRIQGPLCRQRGTPAYAIVVTAREDERARRVAGRDHQPVAEALARIREREASERERYLRFYGIDLDREVADLTIDSSDRPADAVAEAIVAFVVGRESGPRP